MNTTHPSLSPAEAEVIAGRVQTLHARMGEVIHGKDAVITEVLIALLGGGHILIEDLPGLGKTTLAYSLARAIDCRFSRIQFTSDLLPSDILGVPVFDEAKRDFAFRPGPIFAEIVLADEINRSTPKTQSALLEAMDRGKVTVDGQTHALGSPFMVFATQNPVDCEGTFPLPDSQLDRFLIRLEMGYPESADERRILRRGWLSYDRIPVQPVVHGDEVHAWQQAVPRVYVEDSVLEHILRLARATRVEPALRHGLSTRGALALKLAAQACALCAGREFVMPDDVNRVLGPVCIHRLQMHNPAADLREERQQVQAVLNRLAQVT